MARRVIAAVAALILAGVGIVLVLAYASNADERAMADMETVDVLVATGPIAEGTRADQLTGLVEVRAVPRNFLTSGTVDELEDLEGRLLTTPLAAGEQLQAARFSTPEELRAQNEFELPEEAEDLHQVTVPLANPRALGGNIAPGDTVGVFVSIEPKGEDAPSMTHLTLHKVLVVRVEGGYVEAPPVASPDDEDAEPGEGATGGPEEEQAAADTVLVTLALEAPDAERLVFGMEWGQVWLSYEPEDADENGTQVVVVTIPDDARDVYE